MQPIHPSQPQVEFNCHPQGQRTPDKDEAEEKTSSWILLEGGRKGNGKLGAREVLQPASCSLQS